LKFIAVLLLGLLLPVAAMAASAETEQATAAAKAWLALIDAGDYAQSWKSASPFFEQNVTPAKWAVSARSAREPMGAFVSRDVASVTQTNVLPGVADGHYVLVLFKTKFARKAEAAETMAMVLDKGAWKPIGYHLR
jgi:hypothetical protein